MRFLSFWCREFLSHITVYKTHFKIELPNILTNVENVSVIITKQNIILLGNHKPPTVKINQSLQ